MITTKCGSIAILFLLSAIYGRISMGNTFETMYRDKSHSEPNPEFEYPGLKDDHYKKEDPHTLQVKDWEGKIESLKYANRASLLGKCGEKKAKILGEQKKVVSEIVKMDANGISSLLVYLTILKIDPTLRGSTSKRNGKLLMGSIRKLLTMIKKRYLKLRDQATLRQYGEYNFRGELDLDDLIIDPNYFKVLNQMNFILAPIVDKGLFRKVTEPIDKYLLVEGLNGVIKEFEPKAGEKENFENNNGLIRIWKKEIGDPAQTIIGGRGKATFFSDETIPADVEQSGAVYHLEGLKTYLGEFGVLPMQKITRESMLMAHENIGMREKDSLENRNSNDLAGLIKTKPNGEDKLKDPETIVDKLGEEGILMDAGTVGKMVDFQFQALRDTYKPRKKNIKDQIVKTLRYVISSKEKSKVFAADRTKVSTETILPDLPIFQDEKNQITMEQKQKYIASYLKNNLGNVSDIHKKAVSNMNESLAKVPLTFSFED
ncbi:hypothetical protein OAB57_02690 [Bacteriovoracaceae bacterium]|nr:hypothetical protein [Bacteriovoracaceae bacterium]